ncbi:MAG: hypothetical protein J6K76_07450 [Spirochaetaceae bacterium]|nr:hypothetical protein [Spirochaetaceae bacterium]
MTAVAACLIIGVINLILWAVLFLHFKSKYSSEKILEDIADELNKLVRDINNETMRCVTIVKDCRESLLKLIEEAKKYTDLGHESLERKAKSIQVMDAINKGAGSPKRRRTSYSDLAPGVGFPRSPIQQDLFEKAPVDEVMESKEDEYKTEILIDPTGGLGHSPENKEDMAVNIVPEPDLSVPEINISEIRLPEITRAQKQILSEKSLKAKVLELHGEGFALDVIASRLNISLTEVQLIVNMFGL